MNEHEYTALVEQHLTMEIDVLGEKTVPVSLSLQYIPQELLWD